MKKPTKEQLEVVVQSLSHAVKVDMRDTINPRTGHFYKSWRGYIVEAKIHGFKAINDPYMFNERLITLGMMDKEAKGIISIMMDLTTEEVRKRYKRKFRELSKKYYAENAEAGEGVGK